MKNGMINYRKLLYDYARPVEVWDRSNADNERRLRFLKYEAVGNSQHKFTEELTNKAHRMNRKLDLQLENEVSRLAKTHGTNCYEIQRTQEQIQNEEKDTLKKKLTSSKYERLLNGKSATADRSGSLSGKHTSSTSTSRHSLPQHGNNSDPWLPSLRALLTSNRLSRGTLNHHESSDSLGRLNRPNDEIGDFYNISSNRAATVGYTASQDPHKSAGYTANQDGHKSPSKSLPTLSRSRKRSQQRCTTVNPSRRTTFDPSHDKQKTHRYYVRSTYSFSSREANVATPGNKIGGVDLIQLAPNAKYRDGVAIASTKYI